MDEVKKFCVIGLPISHSLSPMIHKEFAKQQGINIQYKMIEPDSEEHFETHAQSFFSKNGYGANVTIPFKEQAYKFANSYDQSAIECDCANTLMLKESEIRAFNTDGKGFINDFYNKDISLSKKDILILGAGGSAKSIINSLVKEDIGSINILTRTPDKAIQLIDKYKNTKIIDDYGHHPEEIKAALSATKLIAEKSKVLAIFQPHRYSRLRNHFNEFCSSFNDADEVILLNVYAAGEKK